MLAADICTDMEADAEQATVVIPEGTLKNLDMTITITDSLHSSVQMMNRALERYNVAW